MRPKVSGECSCHAFLHSLRENDLLPQTASCASCRRSAKAKVLIRGNSQAPHPGVSQPLLVKNGTGSSDLQCATTRCRPERRRSAAPPSTRSKAAIMESRCERAPDRGRYDGRGVSVFITALVHRLPDSQRRYFLTRSGTRSLTKARYRATIFGRALLSLHSLFPTCFCRLFMLSFLSSALIFLPFYFSSVPFFLALRLSSVPPVLLLCIRSLHLSLHSLLFIAIINTFLSFSFHYSRCTSRLCAVSETC